MAIIETLQNDTPIPAGKGSTRGRGRELAAYPAAGQRRFYLGLVVAVTISLYYQLYVVGAVAPLIMQDLQMPFLYFVTVLALSNLIGAGASLLAGLSDRFGRANLVVWGQLIVGLLVLLVQPNMHTRLSWSVCAVAVGFIEGIILVATPALIRDFSPQVGRATAMGFWTVGPVLGSLLVSFIASTTLSSLVTWQSQYEIAGAVGVVMFIISFMMLKELPAQIRDQIMVSVQDRSLVEAKARRIDVEASRRNPWSQMLHLDVIGSALGVSTLLLFYYTSVAFGVIVSVALFGFSVEKANSLANWSWATNAVALIISGVASDRLGVRKPFMLIGGLGALATMIWFLSQVGYHPSYAKLAFITTLQSIFTGAAYTAWMASFTETVEARNPALTGTGLAVWGWIQRLVVAASFFALPAVVNTVNDIVQAPIYLGALHAAQAAHTAPSADLMAHLGALGRAVQLAPGQWRTWFWICCAGIALFLALIFVMKGRWSPAAAQRDQEEHNRLVQQELQLLAGKRTA